MSKNTYIMFFDLVRHITFITHQTNHNIAIGVVLGLLDPVILNLSEGRRVGKVIDD